MNKILKAMLNGLFPFVSLVTILMLYVLCGFIANKINHDPTTFTNSVMILILWSVTMYAFYKKH